MPPTSFFDRNGVQSDDLDDIPYDSVLEQCQSLLPSRRLLWHYRSEDERLNVFSNRNFYYGDLLTFPSSWELHPDLGIKFNYLPNAVYGRGGSRANPEEAAQVIAILEDELTSIAENTVGVTAMSVAQSLEIHNRVEMAADSSEILQAWLDEGGRARNLETIQGDEFDISILSFGYGKDTSGTPQLNFGPLSGDDGYKRLNVAITRARKKTIVVISIQAADIAIGRVGAGGQLVRSILDYAERGPVALGDDLNVEASDVYESPFEEKVARQSRALGWGVDTQVGVSRFRVDLGVRHPELPGKYLVGIECDVATYHSAETAREREIGRQDTLERRGWKIFRIWSTDWLRSRDRLMAEPHSFLIELLDQNDSIIQPDEPHPLPPGSNALRLPRFRQLEHGLEPGTVQYLISNMPSIGDSNGSDDSSDAWLINNLERHGPWSISEVFREVYKSKHIDARLLVEGFKPQGKVRVSAETIWHADANLRLVPVKVARGLAPWKFDCYSDEELLRAMELSCRASIPIKTPEVARVIVRLLGYPKSSIEMWERLEDLLPRAVEQGYLIGDGDGFRSYPLMTADIAPISPNTLETLHPNILELPTQPTIGNKKLFSRKRESGSSKTTTSSSPDLHLIRKAITTRRHIRISYQAAKGPVTNRSVEVYGVSHEYFDALDRRSGEQRTFRIDRFLSVDWADTSTYQTPSTYRPSKWVNRGLIASELNSGPQLSMPGLGPPAKMVCHRGFGQMPPSSRQRNPGTPGNVSLREF